jgi:hypothetical protein
MIAATPRDASRAPEAFELAGVDTLIAAPCGDATRVVRELADFRFRVSGSA